jgi:zinc protease
MRHYDRYRRPFFLTLALLPLLGVAPVPLPGADPKADADQPALKAANALYDGIRTETLENGLRVYLKPIPGTGVVTTMVAYKVGSADEELGSTGLSHYLEHLMFKGTDKIMPGDIDRTTMRAGGANNAYTDTDYTIFHFDFAADRWPVALEIEADRMRNLRIDEKHEFQQEKGAVIEELKRDEDEPWDLENKAILPLLFGKKSPYGHPVIGETAHVKDATDKVIKAHYDKWYHPNNAALVVVGDFDAKEALAKIKTLFGPIPKADLPARKKAPEVLRAKPVRQEMKSKFEVARMLMGYNSVAMAHPDYAALAVLEGILSAGKTCRLYKKLVEGEEMASSISCSNQGGRYPGWFSVQVELLQGKDRDKAERVVLAELKRLADEPPTAAELKRVQQGIVTNAVFARESSHGLADAVAQGVTVTDLDFLKKYLPSVLAVTPSDVQRVAKKYLDPEARVVVWSVPEKKEPEKKEKEEAASASRLPRYSGHRGVGTKLARSARRADAGHAFSLKDARRLKLPNGLTLLFYENHRLPIVVAHAAVRDVHYHEPDDKLGVATLTGYLLDEGTTKHTGQQVAEMIEDVGGQLSLSSGGASVRVLAPQRHLGLSLLFECLSQPAFPKDAFGRNKERLLSGIDEAESQPAGKAQRAFYAAVYGKHPLARPRLGLRKTAEKLTVEDCAAFHKRVFVPENTVVAIVGDFDSREVAAEVEKLTAGWKGAAPALPMLPVVEKPANFAEQFIEMKDAAQLQFYMGHVGVRRDHPDYYKLLVMDYVLGTGPGFTDRLSARLRDREGLAYTVRANISDTADREPGVFTCYIGTDASNYDKVKKEFLEEINRIRDEKPKPEEVDDAKQYLLGNLPFNFTTNAAVAGQLLYIERNSLGVMFLEDFRKAVSAVTAEDVQAVAKKHIDPKRMALVAVGKKPPSAGDK